ncbi:MAG: hypothetical protein QXJ02_02875 [Candidatus Bathyarchaeia archaeon]
MNSKDVAFFFMVLGTIFAVGSFFFGDLFTSTIGYGTVLLAVGGLLFFLGYIIISRPEPKKR